MQRRFDLDWLRVLLFALLVLHHVAVGFIEIGADIYRVVNNDLGGPLLDLFIYFNQSWRLPLLFLISGIGTWFATRLAVGLRPLATRVSRLMVPALFATFVLNVSYGYVIASALGESTGGFLTFWKSWLLEPEPIQVGHTWFLYNLSFYTVILWPLHLLWRRLTPSTPNVPVLLAMMAIGATVIMVVFKPFFWALVGNGYQLPWYLWIFACGYLIGAYHQSVLAWLASRAGWLLIFGTLTFIIEVGMLATALQASAEAGLALAQGGWAAAGLESAFRPYYLVFTIISGLNTWLWCFAFLGLAARYLRRDRPALKVLSPAVFPIYILHFPITLIGLTLIADLQWPWQLKFVVLAVVVYTLSFLIYRIVSAMGPVVYLIGGKQPNRRTGMSQGPV